MRSLSDGHVLVGHLTVRVSRDPEGDLSYDFSTRVGDRHCAELAGALLDLFHLIVPEHPDIPFHATEICTSADEIERALRSAPEDAVERYLVLKEREALSDSTFTCSLCELRFLGTAEGVT